MAEIRDFNRNQYLLKGGKNKKGNDNKKENKNHKEKNTGQNNNRDQKSMDSMLARHRQLKLYTVLAVAAVAAVVAIGAYIQWKIKCMSAIVSFRRMSGSGHLSPKPSISKEHSLLTATMA